jgi:hypothetical protein
MDVNPLREKADSSIRSNFESVSNTTDSSELHPEKLDLPEMTTDDGI